MRTRSAILGGTPTAAKETISDASVVADVAANLETGAVDLTFEFADEQNPTLRAKVALSCPDLGEAESLAYRILEAVAAVHAAKKAAEGGT